MEMLNVSEDRGRAVHRETQSRDDIDYEIVIYSAFGGLYGTFQCSACGITGVNHIFSPSGKEAIDFATAAIEVHHRVNHQSGKTS